MRQSAMSLRICSGYAINSGTNTCLHTECPNGYPHIRVKEGQCPHFVSEFGCDDLNCALDHRDLTEEEFNTGVAQQEKRIRKKKAAEIEKKKQQEAAAANDVTPEDSKPAVAKATKAAANKPAAAANKPAVNKPAANNKPPAQPKKNAAPTKPKRQDHGSGDECSDDDDGEEEEFQDCVSAAASEQVDNKSIGGENQQDKRICFWYASGSSCARPVDHEGKCSRGYHAKIPGLCLNFHGGKCKDGDSCRFDHKIVSLEKIRAAARGNTQANAPPSATAGQQPMQRRATNNNDPATNQQGAQPRPQRRPTQNNENAGYQHEQPRRDTTNSTESGQVPPQQQQQQQPQPQAFQQQHYNAGFQQQQQYQQQPPPQAFQQHYNPQFAQQHHHHQQQQQPFAQGAPLPQDHNYFTNHIKFLQSLPDCTKYIYKLCWDVAKLGNTAPQSIVFCDFPTRHVYSLPLDFQLAVEILGEGLAAATRKRQPTWWTGVLPVSVEDAQHEYNTAITKVFYSEADYAKDLARMAFVPQAPVQQPNQPYMQAPFPGQQQQQQQPQQPQQPPRPSFNQPFGQQPGPQQQQYQQPPPHPQQQYQQQPQYPQQQQYQQQPQYPQQQQYQQYQQYQQGPPPGQYQQQP